MFDQDMHTTRLLRLATSKLRDGFACLHSAGHFNPYVLTLIFGFSLAGTAYAAVTFPQGTGLDNQAHRLPVHDIIPSGTADFAPAKPVSDMAEQPMPAMPLTAAPIEREGIASLKSAEFAGIDPIITGPSSSAR